MTKLNLLKYKPLLIFLLLFGLAQLPYKSDAIPPSHIYQQITNEDGLSNSSINCVYQDSSGLMWFGTWDGLNVYNGTSFRVYKPESRNEKSISNNIIRSIIEEYKSVLWIATDDGVNRLNVTTGEFQRYYFLSGERSTHRERPYLLAKNSNNVIFCAISELGVSYFDKRKNEFVPLQIQGVNTFRLKSLFFDRDNYLWLLPESGELYRVEISMDSEGKVQAVDSRNMMIKDIVNVFPDHDNRMWVLQKRAILNQLDCATGNLKEYKTQGTTFTSAAITSIVTYNNRLLMANATGGVSFYRFEQDGLVHDETLFSGRGIFSLFKGSQDILWVGSDGQGIYKMYPNHKKFQHITEAEIAGITNNPIRCFAETAANSLFVGTKGSGIYRINRMTSPSGWATGSFETRHLNTGNGLQNDAVYALHHKNGYLWIGTDGRGLQVLNTTTGRFQNFFFGEQATEGIEFGSVYSICETSDSVLWLGTSGYGLIKLNVRYNANGVELSNWKQFQFDKYKENWLSSNIIYALYPDTASNSLWIGTRGGGLNRLDLLAETFEVYNTSRTQNGISSNDVLSITGDGSGRIWVGTSYGINSLAYRSGQASQSFVSYFEADGLPNNTIHGIVADEKNDIWISTNNGISKFIQNENRFINYRRSDGLQSNEFSDGAYYQSRYHGYVYFGGISGFNYFHPGEIITSSFEPPVILNFLRLYNKGEIPLQASVSLGYNENFFTLDFSALEFINSEKCEYAYILENFNDEWIFTGNAHTAEFTNVPPGNYVLKVKATNSDRIWSNRIYTLPIHIGLPWWRTGLAYALYTALAIAILYCIYRVLKLRIRDHQSLWKERMNRKKEDEIHEAKLRFFTNIAHEFFTPLTLIYGPCEKINEYKFSDSYVRRHTQIIRSNAERMLSLIQQLMEFRKTESELPPLYHEDVDIPEMIKYISDSFSEIIERQQIRFTIKREEDALFWRTDRSSLEKVIINLVSNAFKYTPDKGEVELEVFREDANLIVRIRNTGKGIRSEDIEKLFNRFKVLDNPEKQVNGAMNIRTGLGLWLTKSLVNQLGGTIKAESEEDKYTSFTVSIPAGRRTAHQEIRESMPVEETNKGNGIAENELPREILSITGMAGDAGESRQRILVVEDDRDIRDFLAGILDEHYQVLTASSANEAFELMKSQLPHLIISDVLMDGINGFEFTRNVKTNPITAHIPVVLLTGKRTVEDQIKGLSEGADVYLPKPFYPAHLKAVTARLLAGRQELKKYYSSAAAATEIYNGYTLNREDYEFIVNTTRIIEDNLEYEGLTPHFISTELAMSKMQFYRKIRELADQAPSEFIRGVRLNFAARRILSTNKTIQEIMFEAGFNNKAYFFREFNKKFGISPGEYRNSARQEEREV